MLLFSLVHLTLSYVEQSEDIVFDKKALKPIICSFGPQTTRLLENEMKVELSISSQH